MDRAEGEKWRISGIERMLQSSNSSWRVACCVYPLRVLVSIMGHERPNVPDRFMRVSQISRMFRLNINSWPLKGITLDIMRPGLSRNLFVLRSSMRNIHEGRFGQNWPLSFPFIGQYLRINEAILMDRELIEMKSDSQAFFLLWKFPQIRENRRRIFIIIWINRWLENFDSSIPNRLNDEKLKFFFSVRILRLAQSGLYLIAYVVSLHGRQ